MIRSKPFDIACPSCGTQQEVRLYESIDVEAEPALKIALMQNRLNRVECIGCDASFRVDMPLLYNDPKNKIMIHWMPEREGVSAGQTIEEFEETLDEVNQVLPDDVAAPRVRLVLTRVELVELIYMIEAGLNQRVVEYVKYSMFSRNPEKMDPHKYRMLLNVEDSTDDELCFVLQNVESLELENVFRYGRSAYQSMLDLYAESPDEFMDMFPGPCISARNLILEEEG